MNIDKENFRRRKQIPWRYMYNPVRNRKKMKRKCVKKTRYLNNLLMVGLFIIWRVS